MGADIGLNLPFPQIAEQLEKIAGDYFGAENLIELVLEQTEDAKDHRIRHLAII